MGGRYELERLLDPAAWRPLVAEAVRIATLNLDAEPCPAGTLDVVLGPGWPGVLLHEAVGHGLEGDFNRKQTSAFSGRLGERVAAEGVTVVDDGTLPGRRGSLNVDDEGTPTGRTVLIENGVLLRLSPGSPERAADGDAADRQRPPRELRASADAAHDQHLHARGPRRSGGDPALGRARHLRGVVRRRPGRHHQREVRVLGQRGLPDRGRPHRRAAQGRHADRQRPGRAHARAGGSATTSRSTAASEPAARTARACRSASACRRCASTASPSGGTQG